MHVMAKLMIYTWCLVLPMSTNAKPLETGWHHRGSGETRAASHFSNGNRDHASEPWSAAATADWQILEHDRPAGRMQGYNDRTGEVFNTAPGTKLASGIGCAGCLLFDLISCRVLSPLSFQTVPHAAEAYDRDRRGQLWRIANAEGVKPGVLPLNFLHAHPPQSTDEIWHVVSERDEDIDMTLFAWTEPGAIGKTGVARRLRCLAGWCVQFSSAAVRAFLSSMLLIALPAGFVDAHTEGQWGKKGGCGTLSKLMLIHAQQRATSTVPPVKSHGVPRARILHVAKSAASDIIFAAEALAPLTGIVKIFKAAIPPVDPHNSDDQGGENKLVGFCDAPHDTMVTRVLQTGAVSFTPEHINVTLPVRAVGNYCRAMVACVLSQVRWFQSFIPCLVGEHRVVTHSMSALYYKATQGLGLVTALLLPRAKHLAASTGFSGGALADEIAEAASATCANVFQLVKATHELASLVATDEWSKNITMKTAVTKFSCCHKHASQSKSIISDC